MVEMRPCYFAKKNMGVSTSQKRSRIAQRNYLHCSDPCQHIPYPRNHHRRRCNDGTEFSEDTFRHFAERRKCQGKRKDPMRYYGNYGLIFFQILHGSDWSILDDFKRQKAKPRLPYSPFMDLDPLSNARAPMRPGSIEGCCREENCSVDGSSFLLIFGDGKESFPSPGIQSRNP